MGGTRERGNEGTNDPSIVPSFHRSGVLVIQTAFLGDVMGRGVAAAAAMAEMRAATRAFASVDPDPAAAAARAIPISASA